MEREIPALQLRRNYADQLDAVQFDGDVLIVTRRGRKAAAVVPLALLDRYRAEQRKDNGLSVSAYGPPAGLPEHPLNTTILTRTELAAQLRRQADENGGVTVELTAGECTAVVGMLRELAGTFSGEDLGDLAAAWAALLDHRKFTAEQQR